MTRSKTTTQNRAEQVRSRRQEQSVPPRLTPARQASVRTAGRQAPARTPVKRAGRYSGTERSQPPVLVRAAPQAAPTPKGKKGGRPKRRFDIELASPGVEVRLPSLPQVQIGWRLLSFILAAGLLALLYYLLTDSAYHVQAAELQGAQRLTSEEINRTLNIVNQSIFEVDPQQLAEKLRIAYPDMKELSVSVGWPATVVVTVTERVPLISWQQPEQTLWVDGDGVAYPPRGEVGALVTVIASAAPPLPKTVEESDLAQGMASTPKAFMTAQMVDAILGLGAQTPEGAPLVYDPQHGLGWTDRRGWEVYFGVDVSQMDVKLSLYQAIVARLKQEKIKPALISVEYIHAPYYRMER